MRINFLTKNNTFDHRPLFYSCGLTLVELMLTLAVFSILIGVGVPMVSNMIGGGQIETQASEIRNILTLARSEAITRRTYITLCARKANSDECLISATNDDWRDNGWILFRDRASSGGANIEYPDSQIIKKHGAMGNSIQLTITGNTSYIRFTPRGESSPNTTFRFCIIGATNERYAEEVIVSGGRVRMVSGEDTGCL